MSVHKNRGFTMIEMVTVVLITGVLAMVAVPSFKNLRINSQISALSGDMSVTLNRARGLAISTRSQVYVIQGPGTSPTDVGVGTDWASGWRVLRGTTPALATVVTRVVRTGTSTDAKVLVTSGAVDAAGTASGAAVTGFGFNNFGQLTTDAGVAQTQAAIVICSAVLKESGRAIAISRAGRVTNNVVTDPPCA
jgi:prepilin-type N-terminal cleavage/methylation domain-containing protein